jgi:hypothetical protein
MARPKTKSALVEGMMELVNSLRNIESQLSLLSKSSKRQSTGRRGRPPGSGKGKRGRPPASGRGPGRPAKGKRGRPAGKKRAGRPRGRRGRPPGSKNK